MKYQALIEHGKVIFNMHPDTDVESISDLLFVARKCAHRRRYYEEGVASLAEHLARFIDERQET